MSTINKPKGDQTLPSGATIHWDGRENTRVPVTCPGCNHKRLTQVKSGKVKLKWTGLCRKCSPRKRATLKISYDEELPSGSTIHWGERALNDPKRVMVTCGKCGRKRLTLFHRGRQRQKTGFCKGCRNRQVHDEKLPSGSIIHYSERVLPDASKCWVTCGKCSKKWLRLTPPPKGVERRLRWRGFCPACAKRKRTQEEQHHTGTKIHWGERDPENTLGKTAITCHQCGQKSFAFIKTIRYPNWSGLCSSCIQQRDSPTKLTEDKTLENGTKVLFSKEKDGMVPVFYAKCGCTRETTRETAITTWKRYGNVCIEHYRNPSALCDLVMKRAGQREPQNGSEQGNGNSSPAGVVEKRGRGRRKGSTSLIPEVIETEVQKTVLSLWDEGCSRPSITANRVAFLLHIGSKENGGDTMMKRLKKNCNIDQSWPVYRDSIIDERQVARGTRI